MTISIGQSMPRATMKLMSTDGPVDVDADELFRNARVAVFGIPGAYTPVCSESHLPGFVKQRDELLAKGLDNIICVSVNDPFVMDAWGKEHQADGITMVADPEGQFTRAIGLSIDLTDFGLGERSQRYSMIVDDGIVENLNIEDSILDHGASSCSTMLSDLSNQ